MTTVKRSLTLLLSFMVLFSINSCGEDKFVDFKSCTETQLNKCLDFAAQSVELYCQSTMTEMGEDGKETVNIELLKNIYADETTLTYLRNKHEFDTHNVVLSNDGKRYLFGNYTVDNYMEIEGYLLCRVEADIHFKYTDFESPSALGTSVCVVIKNAASPQVVDWYDWDNAFDRQVRGCDLDMTEPKNWLMSQDKEQLEKKQEEILSLVVL